ncbi:MAG: 4-phosphoerythronate dehydrogenase [Muribaculaceae bacterium]|nr:4-phosphoerythronate dehydrogenase [Muribaculaceae bacterium]
MKILADSFIPFLRGRLENYADITYLHPDDFNPQTVADADALLIRTRTRCGAPLLSGSRVRFIASGTIGMDQFDLPWCASHDIAAFNSPGCNAPGVAQYVWSSLLHLGIDPAKITLGVIGHGNVGRIVAEWGRHLGARILLCDPPRADRGEKGYIPMEELLAQSDVITLHTPLTHDGNHPTYHLIGERELRLIRPGAVFINAARGSVTDTPALVEAARRLSLRLIIDTWEGEPSDLNPELLALAEIATPHIAGYSLQGKQRATRMITENLCRFFGLPLATKQGEEGVKVWDLPEPYRPVESIGADQIASSYDPVADTRALRETPASFEYMRDHYDYRSEPSAILC